ncbi:MAG: hypothetical protein HYV63_06060 [Candidatus Schekmanbacteria bacterium]|nr:hypothetical protein [Candidatus Schekmanbacteria bacterium]
MKPGPDQTYFSPLDLNVERGELEFPEQLVYRVARQVLNRQGRASGLVVINVFGREILDRLKVLRSDPRGEALFVGSDGRFVRELCGGADCRFLFGRAQTDLRYLGEAVIAPLLAGETAMMVEVARHFVSYSPIHLRGSGVMTPWRLAILYPRELVVGPVNRMRNLAALFAALVAVVAITLSGLATRAFAVPLHRILAFLRRVEAGDFGADLVVETRDEIEELAGCVRDTARALEATQGRLLGWNEELQREVARQVAEMEALADAN